MWEYVKSRRLGADLIAGAIPERGGVWADIGAGAGTFTLAASGAIVALVTDGERIVFEAGGAAFKVLRRYRGGDADRGAYLAVLGDGILVKDAGSPASSPRPFRTALCQAVRRRQRGVRRRRHGLAVDRDGERLHGRTAIAAL